MISHLHHINFIVRDLDAAISRYQEVLGLDNFIIDSLDQRGVKTARVKVGETWLVLVQPLDEDNEPARYLNEFGEGFFLLSFATDDFAPHFDQLDKLNHNKTGSVPYKPRQGLENWTVADLPMSAFFGAQLQLTREELTQEKNKS